MSKPEHSPLPWIAGDWAGSIDCVYDANGDEVCEPSPQNAALIVTACNSYYENKQAIAELVETLERVVTQINDYERANNLAPNPPRTECWDCVADAKALIAKHKAKP